MINDNKDIGTSKNKGYNENHVVLEDGENITFPGDSAINDTRKFFIFNTLLKRKDLSKRKIDCVEQLYHYLYYLSNQSMRYVLTH